MSVVVIEHPKDHEDRGGVAVVRINRPDARNALNTEVRTGLAEAMSALGEDNQVRAIVLTGDETSFAAGADLKEMATLSTVDHYLRHTERLWLAIARCPTPIVAAVNGFALGGGMELAMHCDIIVAGENAQFGQPEVKVGIMPGAGGTQRLTRAVGKFKAMQICLQGRPFSGTEAAAMGLASDVVPDADVFDTAMKIARDIARMPPLAIEQIKEVILHGQDSSLEAGLALERKSLQILFSSEDKKEGVAAFIEKRRPSFKGH